MQKVIILFLCILPFLAHSQDTFCLKVHFLYGSKPVRKYKETEPKWFGGILGGHVGIEGDSDKIVSFRPSGSFHVFAKKKNNHSAYGTDSASSFYSVKGGDPDSVKRAVIYIPVTKQQKMEFDSIAHSYLEKTPYDYALFGMRCGAATYDILAQINVLPQYSYSKTYKKIFYPKKIRKRLLAKADQNNWLVKRYNGSVKRKWETD